jgi:2'-5' RNA ligase
LSGLVLVVPELTSLTDDIRQTHDPAARQGMPPHVTLLYPFVPMPAFQPEHRQRLAAVASAAAPLELSFSQLARFPQVLWLSPEPVGPLAALIAALVEAFPDYPPYGGQFETVIPHVTLAQTADAQLDLLVPVVQERFATPARATVPAISLFATRNRRWHEVERFSLGAPQDLP